MSYENTGLPIPALFRYTLPGQLDQVRHSLRSDTIVYRRYYNRVASWELIHAAFC